jgi:Ni,Fe-hydrogenase III large subunit
MSAIADLARNGRFVATHAPWRRIVMDAEGWRTMAGALADGRLTLVSLWGERGLAHAAVSDERDICVCSVECASDHYPSIGAAHPPAIRLERALRDIFGITPDGAIDIRPWLDHGRWGVRRPLGATVDAPKSGERYDFLPVDGHSLHVIPVGPVHAGIIEPGHFRFTANGETVVRLEQRLGYVHKGIDALTTGQPVERALKLAGRTSGDSTVAYALAFSRAVEAASGIDVPPRAHHLRAVMAELERLANHCGDIGAVCNDATFTIVHAHCGILREEILRAADACFGHRLMMDRIRPGGVAADLDAEGVRRLGALVSLIKQRFPKLVALYDDTASLQDRTVGTGVISNALVKQFGAGGYVGRGAGRAFDVRKNFAYPPYDKLEFTVPTFSEGDVNARVWVRIREVEQSIKLIEQLLATLPASAIAIPVPPPASGEREGAALIEGFRGDVFAWLRLTPEGVVARCHLRDPSWFQWPLLEAAIEGNIVADFPLCNKSFNCSYSGHDL